ncbi:hypothetical protein CR513_34865, partial [Mucuna pruriens]
MTWFLHGFNKEIQDVVELQHYRNLSELVHQAIKVEMQFRRRSESRKTYEGSSGWKGTQVLNLRSNSLQEGEDDTYMKIHNQEDEVKEATLHLNVQQQRFNPIHTPSAPKPYPKLTSRMDEEEGQRGISGE